MRVGVIGAGKFASMFMAQALRTAGMHVAAVCDLDVERARQSLQRCGWAAAQYAAASIKQAAAAGSTCVTDDVSSVLSAEAIEVVAECTGDPAAGIAHALACFESGKHIVMVNVEADALAGPLLARMAEAAGVVYSLAYGDQPALICELVDWARTSGFDVVCAGKGTKYLPVYHTSTPNTVWDYYGLTPQQAEQGGMNAKMFNSFLDGTKSAIEMAAVANATGLVPAADGLQFPPCGAQRLADVLKPKSDGGTLGHKGTVEVVSSLDRDGSEVQNHLRWGVFVTFEAASDYVSRCFSEYGLTTDTSGRYSAMYRPTHLVGLELGISVAQAALQGQSTGRPHAFVGDVVAAAKRDLSAGEWLDGEGGATVWGKLAPASESLKAGGLPIGLASHVKLRQNMAAGQVVRWADVEIDESNPTARFRRQMEQAFASG